MKSKFYRLKKNYGVFKVSNKILAGNLELE